MASVSSVGALRVLNGDIPYRDFWTVYAPGHFYLVALLYKIFGTHLLVERVASALVFTGAGYLVYRLAFNLTGTRWIAWVSAAILLVAAFNSPYHKYLGTYPPALLLITLSLYMLSLYYRSQSLKQLLWVGVFAGAIAVFKHDVGAYTIISIFVGLAAFQLLAPRAHAEDMALRRKLVPLLIFGTGVALTALPVYAYFALVTWQDMWQNIVVFPLTDFRYSRPESYPGILPLGIYQGSEGFSGLNLIRYITYNLPFLLFLGGIVATFLSARKGNVIAAALGVTFLVAYLLHYSAAHVQNNTHLISMSVYAVLLGGMLFQTVLSGRSGINARYAAIATAAFICFWIFSSLALPSSLTLRNIRRLTEPIHLTNVSGLRTRPNIADSVNELAEYIDSRLTPDESIYVGLHRHDIVIIGDTPLYFMLGRRNATRYQELHPAITDTAPIQREIISDLESKRIDLIVLKKIFDDSTLDKVKQDFLRNLPNIGSTLLDDYIHENYLEVVNFGPYAVWERTDY